MQPPSSPVVGSWPFAPPVKPSPVVSAGAFCFAAAFLEHAHICGQCEGLLQAGADLRWVYDPDASKVEWFLRRFPQAKSARALEEILSDPEVKLVAAAAVPSDRAALGTQVMEAGKDYFTDKTPFTTLEQLAATHAAVKRTGRKYIVYYSERLHVESAVYATQLVKDGTIGRVIQVLGLGPHRLNKAERPEWFFDQKKTGGILCDLGSHQCEQFLSFSGATDATVMHAAVGNYTNADHPEFEDFGEASFVGNNGSTHYQRVDWCTPIGLRTWGDGRTVILGEKGYIELRKYIEVGREDGGDQIYLVNPHGEHRYSAAGRVGFPFFGEVILDCLHRTERAMTQAHTFKAAELCLKAQFAARRLPSFS